MTDPNCELCGGDGWVCENHPDKAWAGGEGDCGDGKSCGGAGQLCKCNPAPNVTEDDLTHPEEPDE